MMRNKLQKLLNRLDGTNERTASAIRDFEGGVKDLRVKLQQEISASTLEEVNGKINKLRKSIDLEPIQTSLQNLATNFEESVLSIFSDIEGKSAELKKLTESGDGFLRSQVDEMVSEIEVLRTSLDKLVSSNRTELNLINTELSKLLEGGKTYATKEEVSKTAEESKNLISNVEKVHNEDIKKLDKKIDQTGIDLITRINNKGGGNMNRNIAIGGNVSVLSKFTDINLKAGNNVTITYQNNLTTKYTDITISATGGGGSVGGTIRSINTVNTSQTMGDTAGTDYVYLCTAGIKIDLPVATGNTNLYTVKNVSNSSILIAGTIDDDASGIIMPIKYTSVDLISNDTNFNIT